MIGDLTLFDSQVSWWLSLPFIVAQVLFALAFFHIGWTYFSLVRGHHALITQPYLRRLYWWTMAFVSLSGLSRLFSVVAVLCPGLCNVAYVSFAVLGSIVSAYTACRVIAYLPRFLQERRKQGEEIFGLLYDAPVVSQEVRGSLDKIHQAITKMENFLREV